MQASIKRMGNAAGIILPKPLLAKLGIHAGDEVTLTLENGRLILTPAIIHAPGGRMRRKRLPQPAMTRWSGLTSPTPMTTT